MPEEPPTPTPGGYRTGRMEAFSDGVFAIAITLLVLNLTVESGLPGDRLWHEIWDLHEDFIAFGISFAVIARFWVVHHHFFGEVRAFDGFWTWFAGLMP